jgi:hypothetical protein
MTKALQAIHATVKCREASFSRNSSSSGSGSSVVAMIRGSGNLL